MRISDWSSDVCSSDLIVGDVIVEAGAEREIFIGVAVVERIEREDPAGDREAVDHRILELHRGLETLALVIVAPAERCAQRRGYLDLDLAETGRRFGRLAIDVARKEHGGAAGRRAGRRAAEHTT